MYGTFKYNTGLISLRSRSDKSLSTVKNPCKNLLKNKIHEALLMKKHRPSLRKQLYAHGSSFPLNVYK